MSAIAGLLHLDGLPVTPRALCAMAGPLAHRGPDGAGFWRDGAVGLAHLALHTTPESRAEQQPLCGPARLTLVADARIDNRADLIAALFPGASGSALPSDGALILAAYARWGESCAAHLIGDFAFALWDGDRQRLLLARDQLGVKPLYYCKLPGSFAFATAVGALLALPEVPRDLDELGMADYVAPLFDDVEVTLYSAIRRLPAAHTLVVGAEGSRAPRRYWSLDDVPPLRLRDEAAYVEAYLATFTEAVRCRLRSAGPVGSTLSGGLDSSSIACTAASALREHGQQLHTFSAIFPGLPDTCRSGLDERRYIDAALACGGMHPHMLEADRLAPLGDLEAQLQHVGEALRAPNLYMHWGLYRAAHGQGVRVLLDGIDGDTTVSHGLERFRDLARAGRVLTLIRQSRALARRAHHSYSWRRIAWEFGLLPLVPEPVMALARRLRGLETPPLVDNPTVSPAFARRVGLEQRALEQSRQAGRATTAQAMHRAALASGQIPYTLELLSHVAGAWQLEPRYPYFDLRLIELCFALPVDLKLRDGWTRYISRQAMEAVLPESVRWRTWKANLSPNLELGLIARDRIRLEATLAAEGQAIWDYIDRAALVAAYNRFVVAPLQHSREALHIYLATVLSTWLQTTRPEPGSGVQPHHCYSAREGVLTAATVE